jgi:S-DNA-T family DNA segregation ATPase FtsK/SpoIIIE
LETGGGKLFDRNDVSGKVTSFIPDISVPTNPEKLSIKLSNIHLDSLAGTFNLPQMLTFLEMFGVGKVEHLNALSRWKENNPVKSLKAAVGVDTAGDLFQLDLHEKFHGPHGLVAGMTGSGKSEFIITYILSLAVNYHPNEVAFILIDYKGGGMAKSFENLPHTAGIITNLDGSAIKRSLVSIESELKRRQAIFVEAGQKIGVSNIDIYKYQRLYREGTVNEPLQHLFIISDEFAELKTQQPEFMAKLVSAARIGRSLGIHLILATQKPAGVVDDQIWSNSRFRVCLKVQERADSMDMLKRPDAAELSDTGRFYLQVGYNELFETGQSAWAGAPYHPSDKVFKDKDNSVVFIDINGRPIREVKPITKRDLDENPPKQLDVITEYLGSIAAEENIKIKTLWLEPIPEMILVDSLRAKYNVQTIGFELNPVIGEYDDPAKQRQDVLRLPLSSKGNTLVYGMAGGGKTTFLTSAIYSLMREHTPEEVNIYILDFASETLRAFVKAPHVGDVVLSFEAEKITNLFMMLTNEIDNRKKLFTDYGGDHRSYIEATGEKVPSIVVIINNYAAFAEMYMEQEDVISYLTREGIKYGIYFILTTAGVNSIRYKLQQNFSQIFALQLTADSDYNTLLGKTDGLLPSKFKGRGLIKTDEVYEFQTAHIVEDNVQIGYVRSISDESLAAWKGKSAPPIPMLPEYVNVEYISSYIQNKDSLSIPIGVENKTLAVHYYDFGTAFVHLILSNNEECLPFIGALSELMMKEYNSDVVIFDSTRRFSEQFGNKQGYYSNAGKIEETVDELYDILNVRAATYKQAVSNGKTVEKFEPKVIIINALSSLKGTVSSKCGEKLTSILETGMTYYNITVIIAEAAKNLTNYSYDKWYKQHITQNDGIWVGDGFSAQYHIKPCTITKEMREATEDDFGFSLIKGKAVKIKVLSF